LILFPCRIASSEEVYTARIILAVFFHILKVPQRDSPHGGIPPRGLSLWGTFGYFEGGMCMSLLQVSDLTFCYEGSFDNIFEEISFSVDTDWKLGFIGRNGKGKTTFLNLLLGKYPYSGSITSNTAFDYFPYPVSESDLEKTASDLIEVWKPQTEIWQVLIQLDQIKMDAECLYRPFGSLSFGERTRVMLAVLFAGDNEFLLIDEPTNHLDGRARESVKEYLASKKGFILVSHDRDLLDGVCDHVLVLNRSTIEVQSGSFSSWWDNKEKEDNFARAENEKHLKEIGKLKASADRADRWAIKNEATKIGYDPIEEHDRFKNTRGYIGAKTKKMQSRVKNFEKRIGREIEEKEGLLSDIEEVTDLKLMPLTHHKNRIVELRDFSLKYDGNPENAVDNVTFELFDGERLFLAGLNGCGKSSIIKAILKNAGYIVKDNFTTSGTLTTAAGLIISYINQDTSHLSGTLKEYALHEGLDCSLFLSLLRQLDLELGNSLLAGFYLVGLTVYSELDCLLD
jgi:lincosamide and streptogramin A transport system ATP-binding/permease protein